MHVCIYSTLYRFNYFLPLAVDFIIAIIRFSDYLPADMSLPSAGELVNTSGGHVCIYRLYYIATV